MDMMSDFDNLDIMIGNENNNPIEREYANTIGEFTGRIQWENSPQGDEFRNFNHGNNILDKMKFYNL